MSAEQDLAGRVCLITGANTGIGRVAAEALARRGAKILLACRSEERTASAIEAIRARSGEDAACFLPLDLGSLASVRACAEQVLSEDQPLHVLINNAGLVSQAGVTTADGFERTFGVNHLGHFLLTLLLLERLKASAPARIVNVASRSHYHVENGIDFDALRSPGKTITGMSEYAVSKLSNVLFTRELASRLAGTGVKTYALHPGVVATDIWRRVPWPFRGLVKLFMISPEDGAATTLHCAASSATAAETGLYYDECKVKEPSVLALDDALAETLWAKSLEWTGAPDLLAPAEA